MGRQVPVRAHVRKSGVAVAAHQRTVHSQPTSGKPTPGQGDGLAGLATDATEGTNFSKRNLQGFDFSGRDLTGYDFTEADLTGANFTGCDLTGATFDGAMLDDANFTGAQLVDTSLKDAAANGTVFDGAVFDGATLNGATLQDVSMVGAVFQGEPSDLTGAYFELKTRTRIPGLADASFLETSLANIDWSGEDLRGGRLTGIIRLSDSVLDGADVTGEEIEGIRFCDVSMRDLEAEGTSFYYGELQSVDVTNGNFKNAGFFSVEINDTSFTGSVFDGARMERLSVVDTSFDRVSLRGGHLLWGDITACTFRDTDFTDADLSYTNFVAPYTSSGDEMYGAPDPTDLTGARWDNANLNETRFGDLHVDRETGETSRVVAIYEAATVAQKAAELGVDELGVLLWAGEVVGYDPTTGKRVTGTFDMDNVHFPRWAQEARRDTLP